MRFNKYTLKRGNKKSIQVRSKLEAKVLYQLEKEKVDYKYEPRKLEWFDKIGGSRCEDCGSKNISKRRLYLPDVILGTGTVLEIKGKFTSRDRKLAKGIRARYPKLDFRYVFDKDNKLSKNTTTRYSDWCKAQGILCCFKGVISKEWLDTFKGISQASTSMEQQTTNQ